MNARAPERSNPSVAGRLTHASATINAGPMAADSLLMNASAVARRLAAPNPSRHAPLAMNVVAAVSIQKSANPSKRAAIHATASAEGANHAKASPATTAAERAPRAVDPASCHASSATSAAFAAWSRTLTRRHAVASAPFNIVLAANEAIVSGRYWLDGGPTPDTKVFATRAATSFASAP